MDGVGDKVTSMTKDLAKKRRNQSQGPVTSAGKVISELISGSRAPENIDEKFHSVRAENSNPDVGAESSPQRDFHADIGGVITVSLSLSSFH